MYIGSQPAPTVPSIMTQSNSSVLISWSMSDCAVQYVVTIINSSDGSVYLNITTSDTNTTVTLPTGVEYYCVTVLGVDSIGRRGPPSQQQCYTYGEYNYYNKVLLTKNNYFVINVVLQFQVQDLLTLVHVCLVYSHIECIVSV